MIAMINFALNVAWKVLIVMAGWYIFRYVVRNGKGTMRDILDTITAVMKAVGHWIRERCFSYLKKEAKKEEAEAEVEGTKVEATVK